MAQAGAGSLIVLDDKYTVARERVPGSLVPHRMVPDQHLGCFTDDARVYPHPVH
jgi:hypothetical protein